MRTWSSASSRPGQFPRRPHEARFPGGDRRDPRADRRAARHERRSRPPPASAAWSTPIWPTRCAKSRSGAATIRAISCCSPMAAPGPRIASAIGAELGVPRILVPATSMAHSAYGALASDIHQSAERSLVIARRRRHARSLGRARLRKHQHRVRRIGTALCRGDGAIGIFARRIAARPHHRYALPAADARSDGACARRPDDGGRGPQAGRAVRRILRGGLRQGRRLPFRRHRAHHVPRGCRRPHAQTFASASRAQRARQSRNAAAFSSRRRSPGPTPPSSSGWTCRSDFAPAARPWSSIRKRRSMSGQARARGSTTPAIFPSISLSAVLEKWEPVFRQGHVQNKELERAMNTLAITDHPAAARRSIRSPSR